MIPNKVYALFSSEGKVDSAAGRIQQLEVQVLTLEHEIWQLTLFFKFGVTDEDYRYYTRFSSKKVFTVFWEPVYPSASRLHQGLSIGLKHSEQPKWRRAHSESLNWWMNCCSSVVLQLGFRRGLCHLSVSRIILTWTSYLYQVLGSLPSWMTREQVQATMPDRFRLYCPQLRVIIGCTEIRCETASSLSLQPETFSSYKNHTTFKGLTGVAPCITFVSTLYTGSVSDIEITKKSQLLQLLQPGDEVMADKGFLIERMLSEVGVKLIIPPLKKSTRLSKEDTQKTQAIARLRILVERAIRRVKEHHICSTLYGRIGQSAVGHLLPDVKLPGTSWYQRGQTSLRRPVLDPILLRVAVQLWPCLV